jgi:uncharacterized lipoprotein NlpE involved in copper resistance
MRGFSPHLFKLWGMRMGKLLFTLFILLLLLVGCTNNNLKGEEVVEFINNNKLKVDKIININNFHYLFYENSGNSGIYVLKGKENNKIVYRHSQNFQDNKIFLGSGEKGAVGLIVRDKKLLEKTAYIKLYKKIKKIYFLLQKVKGFMC